MDAHAHGKYRLRKATAPFVAAALAEIEARGPIAASDLTDRGNRGKHAGGWSWSDGKRVMGGLLLAGQVAVAGRRGIEQLYDLTERVIPRACSTRRCPILKTPSASCSCSPRGDGRVDGEGPRRLLPHRRLPRPGADPNDDARAPRWSPICVDDGRLRPGDGRGLA